MIDARIADDGALVPERPGGGAQKAMVRSTSPLAARLPWEASQRHVLDTSMERYAQPMAISCPTYITTRRSTNSDVESIVTTVRRLDHTGRQEKQRNSNQTDISGTCKPESRHHETKKAKRKRRGEKNNKSRLDSQTASSATTTTITRIDTASHATTHKQRGKKSNQGSNTNGDSKDPRVSLPQLKRGRGKRAPGVTERTAVNATLNAPPPQPLATKLIVRKTNSLLVQNNTLSVARLRAILLAEKAAFVDSLHRRREQRSSAEASATVKMQTAVRGFLSRLWMMQNLDILLAGEHIEKSRNNLDKQVRSRRAEREMLERLAEEMRLASIKIQNQVRGYQARRNAASKKNATNSVAHNRAQLVIALAFRRFRARQHVGMLLRRREACIEQSACALVQAHVRKLYANRAVQLRRFTMRSVASGMIQRTAKMHLARKAVRQRLILRRGLQRDAAALRIQCMARQTSSIARTRQLRLLFEHRLRHAAALFIQCGVRRFFAQRVRQLIAYTRRDVLCEIFALRLQGWARLQIIAKKRVELRKAEVSRDLFFQTRMNNIASVEALFHDGSGRYNAQSIDRNGNTILLTACKHGHIELVLKCITDWNMVLEVLNNRNESALHLALQGGHGDLAQKLIQDYEERLDFSAPKLLHLAASRGLTALIPLLLERRITIDCEDPVTNQSVLHWTVAAAKALTEERCNRMIFLLHGKGASLDKTDRYGSTCLHFACAQGLELVCTTLLKLGACTGLKNGRDETPWATCLRYGHTACAKIVADHMNNAAVAAKR